jgi:hypothetical protein
MTLPPRQRCTTAPRLGPSRLPVRSTSRHCNDASSDKSANTSEQLSATAHSQRPPSAHHQNQTKTPSTPKRPRIEAVLDGPWTPSNEVFIGHPTAIELEIVQVHATLETLRVEQAAVHIQRVWRCWRLKRLRSAVHIQRWWKALIWRRNEEEAAARTIQRWYRRHFARGRGTFALSIIIIIGCYWLWTIRKFAYASQLPSSVFAIMNPRF